MRMFTARRLPLLVTMVIFVAGYALCATQYPSMLSFRTMGDLLTDNAALGILGVGMTFVILSGGIDLSVGAVVAFSGVFIAVAIERLGMPPLVAFGCVLVITSLFGAGMGSLIHWFRVPAFIVTLVGMFLARGLSAIITTDSVAITAPLYAQLNGLGVPLPGQGRLSFIAIVLLVTYLVGGMAARYSRFGRSVYAVGGNAQSAALMGVPVGRTLTLIYTVSGFCAGLAGIVFSLYTSAGYPLAAVGTELDTIAAVVIGGTLLTGGYGSVGGTLVGVLIQGLIQTYIAFDGTLSSWWTKIVVGAMLAAFIVLQRGLLGIGQRRGH